MTGKSQTLTEGRNFDIPVSVQRNIIPSYSQRDAAFLDLFIYFYRGCTCFRLLLHGVPSPPR